MVTFNEILELDVSGLETFADHWGLIHKKIKEAREGFHDDVVRKLHSDHWIGEGGEAAQRFCDRALMDIDALDAEVKSLRDFLDKEADGSGGRAGVKGLEGLKREAHEIQNDAFAFGTSVDDNGSVATPPVMYDPDSPDAQNIVDENERKARAIEKRAKSVLEKSSSEDEWISVSLKVIFGTVHNFESENRKYDIVDPTAKDYRVRNQLNNVGALANARGWKTTAGLVKHFIEGDGRPVEVEPQQMLQDIPQFQTDLDKTMHHDVSKLPDGNFTTDWQSTAPNPKDGEKSMDWYYGLNHFQYRVVGEKHGDAVDYHVEVKKKYDWGVPSEHRRTQEVFGGPFKISLEQADLAHLNTTGLGHDFDVRGSSEKMRTTL